MSSLVENNLNDQLAEMGDYQECIADMDIASWRNAFVEAYEAQFGRE